MNATSSNPCTRCGKERVSGKTWTEHAVAFFGDNAIIHTEYVCPDPECQKIVEEKLDIQKKKTQLMQQDREDRMQKNKEAKKNAKI